MNIKIIKPENYVKSEWSGGVTSQIYIYPETAQYKERNFKFRISMAIAYDDYSTYTNLPEVTRYLVSLDGTAVITHDDRYSIELTPFGNVDCFMGDWKTTAKGAIKDFNLMLANGAKGKMQVAGSGKHLIEPMYTHSAFYFSCVATIEIDGNVFSVQRGDTLLLNSIDKESFIEIYDVTLPVIRCDMIA